MPSHKVRTGTVRSTCSPPQVVRAVPGAPLVVFELQSVPVLGKLIVFRSQRFFEDEEMAVGGLLPQGFPLNSIPEHVSHKVRTGTVRSTCSPPRVVRAVPGAPLVVFELQSVSILGKPIVLRRQRFF